MSEATELFREEALKNYSEPKQEGDLLRISPRWLRWGYWLLVAVFLTGVLYTSIGTVNEYASGPAIVRVNGRTEVTATSSGVVAAVEAHPGQRVKVGELLVRFYEEQEASQLEYTKRQFELQLAKVLRDPSDQGARAALTALRAERELAEARLEERSVRAPHAGIVSDVRIRPGQHLAPGEPILSLVSDDAKYSVVAMLPGHYRPLLKPGMGLRLELLGYRYSYRELTIDSIGEEVVGPAEVRRFLGQEVGDTVPVPGPVVLVKAKLPTKTFKINGQTVNYFDGMHATAEARIKGESVLVTLIPALKALWGDG
ncbi:MAG: HlyD family efflux transporter periplasmic adaptor subunit [Deltaproteobacteria bacterium]|nr:HlyD family efflux transporter periplasmic adaptor subunit [Deltaproteobacteria bacterium]